MPLISRDASSSYVVEERKRRMKQYSDFYITAENHDEFMDNLTEYRHFCEEKGYVCFDGSINVRHYNEFKHVTLEAENEKHREYIKYCMKLDGFF